jgi:hypothetical protein
MKKDKLLEKIVFHKRNKPMGGAMTRAVLRVDFNLEISEERMVQTTLDPKAEEALQFELLQGLFDTLYKEQKCIINEVIPQLHIVRNIINIAAIPGGKDAIAELERVMIKLGVTFET